LQAAKYLAQTNNQTSDDCPIWTNDGRTPEFRNAELEIDVRESGRVRIVTQEQPSRKRFGILANCDGVSNITDNNPGHSSKIDLPRLETEEGTVNEVRL
jgi:hypothetical protein